MKTLFSTLPPGGCLNKDNLSVFSIMADCYKLEFSKGLDIAEHTFIVSKTLRFLIQYPQAISVSIESNFRYKNLNETLIHLYRPMPQENRTTINHVHRLEDIDSRQWNLCANPPTLIERNIVRFDPFVSYEFLNALEESGSAIAETGWSPHHLVESSSTGELIGVMPMYVKSHSMGEYVFDYGWAEAFQRVGGTYYPKLQVAVPFTPVTGRRILLRAEDLTAEARLLKSAMDFLTQYDASSLHLTFLNKATWERLGNQGFLKRIDQQFHWQNQNYDDFSDFLSSLSSKKRRHILKERKLALQNSIQVEHLTGNDLTEFHWDHFFEFYQETGSRKWGHPYLTREFFSLIGQSLRDNILLIVCKRNGRYIAGALNFIGNDTLFGRYWGCLEHHPYLHFEICYYQAIDFAIQHKLTYVEAGAQGEHKLARGYTPTYTYSAHWIANQGFRNAVACYLNSERDMVMDDRAFLMQHSPYRKC